MKIMELDKGGMVVGKKQIDRLLDTLFKFDGTDYELYTLLFPCDTEMLIYVMAKANSEKVKRLISHYFTKLKGKKVLLEGNDLLEMGFQGGPVFKEIFERLLEARLNRLVETRDDEIRFVQETFPH